MKTKLPVLCLCALFVAQSFGGSQPRRHETSEEKSARTFVQGFYDWYTSKALANQKGPLWDVVLKARRSSFTPSLLKALHEDAVAASKSKDEIVGLDFDPFLNSQDPDSRYFAGKVTHQGMNWTVSVSSGSRTKKPSVIAKLEKHNRSWRFTNFAYPRGEDLLGTLAQLKRARK
jgi:hypothetical protein